MSKYGYTPKARRGTDNAWQTVPLVDGRAAELLRECGALWHELAELLAVAEQGSALGTGAAEVAVTTPAHSRGLESRLDDRGRSKDAEVRQYRAMRDRWLRKFNKLINDMEVDIGHRAPLQGPRDNQGRLRILVSASVETKASVVYFVELNGHIKIGTTTNMKQRLATLNTGGPTPVRLLATIEGNREMEQRLHKRFAHLRVNGEWFEHRDELASFIARVVAQAQKST